MNIVLWMAQIALAFVFLMAGAMKVAKTKAELAERMSWVEDLDESRILSIGILEVLGAIGLIVPAITGVGPLLVPLAATGLAITMLLAARVHLRRSEMPNVAVTVILLVPLVLVAWGRFGDYAF
jgi:uncharacterized membrane protein YphA (DoxX/SURF4 family)